MFSMRLLKTLILYVACTVALHEARGNSRAVVEKAAQSIMADTLNKHVEILADDIFEGREAGTRGGRAAATYLQKMIASSGLPGGGAEGRFFQPFSAGYRNLLILVEGSGADLGHEVILVGAHYDHVGYGTRTNSYGPLGRIHNGADDNASGTAAILELTEAFGRLDRAPRRSILLALWDGEEKGLLGSRHWIHHPTVPIENVRLMINLDMVGRLRKGRLEIAGTRTGWGLRHLVSRLDGDARLWLDFKWKLKSNSDHWPFYERGIPVLLVHTGLHDDYHRPSDDSQHINADGLRDVTRYLFRTIYGLAEEGALPEFRAASRHESVADRRRLHGAAPRPRPRLGVTWDQDDTQPGALLTGVRSGSPAARAGLGAGDRIVRFGSREIHDGEDLRQAVMVADGPVEVQVVAAATAAAAEGSSPLSGAKTIALTLDGKPMRVGISWRADEAEPVGVLITRVVAGSAADRAGLRRGDRIYAVDGRDVQSSTALAQQLAEANGGLSLTVERNGRVQTLIVELPAVAQSGASSVARADDET